ncbi:MAG: DUF2309 domain-containing protein [Planctomycetota bacterium]
MLSENSPSIENKSESVSEMNNVFLPKPRDTPYLFRQLEELLREVSDVVSPVRHLKDFVAVNPYEGTSGRKFLEARSFMRVFSDSENLMPLEYYSKRWSQQHFDKDDLVTAIQELGVEDVISADLAIETLESADLGEDALGPNSKRFNAHRILHTVAEYAEADEDIVWTEIITDEVSKYCASYYDQGQASWASPWKGLPLYQSWRSAAVIDRNIEIRGLEGFRGFVGEMPHMADAAIVWLLNRLGVPEALWKAFLLCQAYSLRGWFGWAKQQSDDAKDGEKGQGDFAALLAIRLAYDVALAESSYIHVDWDAICKNESASFGAVEGVETTLRHVALRASEVAYRKQLLDGLKEAAEPALPKSGSLAQMVFCIDVRSERIRRQLETAPGGIETFGFAGFFGMPIEYVRLGETKGTSHVPVLIEPEFQIHECPSDEQSQTGRRSVRQSIRSTSWLRSWNSFQRSANGCFAFVESMGFAYTFKLISRSISKLWNSNASPIASQPIASAGPSVETLEEQGVTITDQIDLAESLLKGLGLTTNFARLVVWCGHASQSENNPTSAALDCGACGGHSGEPNARMAARLLNQTAVREGLGQRGIAIPEQTHFVSALHNTTTEDVVFFDVESIPPSHQGDMQELIASATTAGQRVRNDSRDSSSGQAEPSGVQKAADWSEVRPEWGLAGNAAFVIGPRSMTADSDLDSRVFLHSYDHRTDETGERLESIITAPVVVAHWINMQYYASTVDPMTFGSGDKTLHNVVGRFGVQIGNGGDLQVGLPWQSLHRGDDFQHLPMRLQVVVNAPVGRIDQVLEKHGAIADLFSNGWMHLVAIDGGVRRRFADGGWLPMD